MDLRKLLKAKEGLFLILFCRKPKFLYLCERFIYFKREYENSYLYHRQKQLHLSRMFAFLLLCKHRQNKSKQV
jgi:hypothetical protein